MRIVQFILLIVRKYKLQKIRSSTYILHSPASFVLSGALWGCVQELPGTGATGRGAAKNEGG